MDYQKIAAELLRQAGGAGNIVSAAHCATRLRLVIADNSKVSKKGLENVDGVKGVFEAQGQLQIIFGTGVVNKVYDAFLAAGGISAASKEEAKAAAASRQAPSSALSRPSATSSYRSFRPSSPRASSWVSWKP